MSGNGVVRTLVDIFTSPTHAFMTLREKPRILFPLILLMACNVAVTVVYMRAVDIPWLVETSSQAALTRLSDSDKQQAIERISKISPTVVMVGAVVQGLIFLPILLFLPAAYFALVSLLTNDGYKLSRWFALVCWCALPLLVAQLASVVNVLAGDASHLAPEKLNPLSFGNLFELSGPPRNVGDRLFKALSLTSIWSLALLVFGYQMWTDRPLGKATGIVLAPVAVVAAVIAFFSLR